MSVPSLTLKGKVVLSFLIGLGCAAIWAYGGYVQQGASVDMAAMPMQRAMMRGSVTKPEEMTMTKRQFLKKALAASAAMLPMTAMAAPIDEETKKKICAAQPTAAACSSKPNAMYVYSDKKKE